MAAWRSLTTASPSPFCATTAALQPSAATTAPITATRPIIRFILAFPCKFRASSVARVPVILQLSDQSHYVAGKRWAHRLQRPRHKDFIGREMRAGSGDGAQDVLAAAWPLSDALVVFREARRLRPLDRVREPAVDIHAEADVGESEVRAGDVAGLAEAAFEDAPDADRALPRVFERCRVALLRRRAVMAEEEHRHRRVDRGELPIHPALDDAALNRVLRVEAVGAARRREIGRLLRLPESAAGIDALEGDADFLAGPQHLLHIRRIGSPPNLQHGVPSADRWAD